MLMGSHIVGCSDRWETFVGLSYVSKVNLAVFIYCRFHVEDQS